MYDNNSIYRVKLLKDVSNDFKANTIVYVDYSSNLNKFRILNIGYFLDDKDINILQKFNYNKQIINN